MAKRNDAGPSVRLAVRERYKEFPPAERRLADLVLNFPGELAGYSASELSKMAETSTAAVSRFVRRLGFRSFDEMRRRAREERESGAPPYLIASHAADGGQLVGRHVETVLENVQKTFSEIDRDALAALVEAIAVAPRIWTIGYRHSQFLASYLRWSLAHARPDVRGLPNAGETLGESLVDLGAGDVLLAVAMRRRPRALLATLAAARAAGSRVALITDPGMADTQDATWVFRCESRTKGPIDDHAPVLVLLHVLVIGVIARLGADARRRLGAIDDLHTGLAEL